MTPGFASGTRRIAQAMTGTLFGAAELEKMRGYMRQALTEAENATKQAEAVRSLPYCVFLWLLTLELMACGGFEVNVRGRAVVAVLVKRVFHSPVLGLVCVASHQRRQIAMMVRPCMHGGLFSWH